MGAGADANETGHGWGSCRRGSPAGFEGAFAERPKVVLTPRRRGLSGEEASTQVISVAQSSRSELEKRRLPAETASEDVGR